MHRRVFAEGFGQLAIGKGRKDAKAMRHFVTTMGAAPSQDTEITGCVKLING